jgi:Gamma-glutamyltranspeptidase
VAQGFESNETTHYSVVDADGMAVSVTYTLETRMPERRVIEMKLRALPDGVESPTLA